MTNFPKFQAVSPPVGRLTGLHTPGLRLGNFPGLVLAGSFARDRVPPPRKDATSPGSPSGAGVLMTGAG